MTVDTAIARPYTVPQSGGRGAAIALAVVMHVLLGVLLFFGIRWQSSPPESIEAELWSPTVQTAAPRPVPVPPPPRVEAPRPEPKVEEPKPEPKADIAEKTKVEPKKKPEPRIDNARAVEPPKPRPKPEPKPVPKVEAKPKPEPVKAPPTPAAPSDLKNLLASANEVTSPQGGTGHDQQTSGPRGRDTWKGRLQNAIRSQMRYPQSCPASTVVSMRIELLPNGEVSDVSVGKPSGVPSFDQAVERAVRAASPLPRDEQGRIPERSLLLDYKLCET